MDNQDNKPQTKFPQKQTKLNQAEIETKLNEATQLNEKLKEEFDTLLEQHRNFVFKEAKKEFEKLKEENNGQPRQQTTNQVSTETN